MLYLEQGARGKGWIRVFSTTDNDKELDKFRCLVHAPRHALHVKAGKGDRTHLTLYGTPKNSAEMMLPAHLCFATPIQRVTWERTQPEVVAKYPVPWMGGAHG